MRRASGVGRHLAVHVCATGDNKARALLLYVYDLKRRGIIDKGTTCMLIVGHTHIDVDQIFSVFSRALTAEMALTLPCYARVISGSFKDPTKAPAVIELVEARRVQLPALCFGRAL